MVPGETRTLDLKLRDGRGETIWSATVADADEGRRLMVAFIHEGLGLVPGCFARTPNGEICRIRDVTAQTRGTHNVEAVVAIEADAGVALPRDFTDLRPTELTAEEEVAWCLMRLS